MKHIMKKAFTLAEVLLAVVIVGIIAALVIPAVVTKYQRKVMDSKASRQILAIQEAMNGLAVAENKTKFSDTSMYVESESYSADETAGKFLKKYFKISKYCGAPSGGKSDCFADEYYEYSDKDKKIITPELKGACAILKNGISLCLTPQIGSTPAEVVMDVNGPAKPNIMGDDKDFRKLARLNVQSNLTPDKVRQAGDNPVAAIDAPPIIGAEDAPCASSTDTSTACCKWRQKNNEVKLGHARCANPVVGPTEPKCVSKITVHLNFYPTGGTSSGTSTSSTALYIDAANNTYTAPSNKEIPGGLSIQVKCANGNWGPTMSAGIINSALNASSGKYYFSGNVTDKSCFHPYEEIVWANNGSKTITYDNVTYEITKH